jgi:signal peptidase II
MRATTKPNALPWLLLSALLIAIDQWTKLLALSALQWEGNSIAFIHGFWNWKLAYNRGAAFSFLAGAGGWQHWFFVMLAFAISAFLIVALRRTRRADWRNALPFALIVAGALGNVVDRLRVGHVIDFVDWYVGSFHWPVFNVADACIVAGAVGLVLFSFGGKKGG